MITGSAVEGPAVRVAWARRDRHRAATALAVLGLALASLMAVFGLPAADLHGPLHRLGIMDPLCGGTRAARLTVLGDWRAAWDYNPLGIAAVLGAAATLARSLLGWTTHRWLTVSVDLTARARRWWVAAAVAATVALEIRQQLRVDLLVE